MKDVQRAIEVDEGVQGVAGGVLHAVLVADTLVECRVGSNLSLELQQTLHEVRSRHAKHLVGARIGRVDDGARREDKGEGVKGMVGVLGNAATHPAGIIGKDAAHHAGINGSRIGSHLDAIRAQGVVNVATDHARLEPNLPALLFHP